MGPMQGTGEKGGMKSMDQMGAMMQGMQGMPEMAQMMEHCRQMMEAAQQRRPEEKR
jgi:hypothetical protein